jgi:phosphoribosylanthranilate isomerase
MRVKICGITVLDDALCAVQAGADALGFVFWPPSPRCVEPDAVRLLGEMLPPFVLKVGVFVDESVDAVKQIVDAAHLDAAQLHGDESVKVCAAVRGRCRVFKAFRMKDESVVSRMKDYDVDGLLLDAFVSDKPGGTGTTFNWELALRAKELGKPVLLSGGLNPENVAAAIHKVQPYAVDVSSGVESSPGKKDHDKVRAFLRAAKGNR